MKNRDFLYHSKFKLNVFSKYVKFYYSFVLNWQWHLVYHNLGKPWSNFMFYFNFQEYLQPIFRCTTQFYKVCKYISVCHCFYLHIANCYARGRQPNIFIICKIFQYIHAPSDEKVCVPFIFFNILSC